MSLISIDLTPSTQAGMLIRPECTYCGDATVPRVQCWECGSSVCIDCADLHDEDHAGWMTGD